MTAFAAGMETKRGAVDGGAVPAATAAAVVARALSAASATALTGRKVIKAVTFRKHKGKIRSRECAL